MINIRSQLRSQPQTAPSTSYVELNFFSGDAEQLVDKKDWRPLRHCWWCHIEGHHIPTMERVCHSSGLYTQYYDRRWSKCYCIHNRTVCLCCLHKHVHELLRMLLAIFTTNSDYDDRWPAIKKFVNKCCTTSHTGHNVTRSLLTSTIKCFDVAAVTGFSDNDGRMNAGDMNCLLQKYWLTVQALHAPAARNERPLITLFALLMSYSDNQRRHPSQDTLSNTTERRRCTEGDAADGAIRSGKLVNLQLRVTLYCQGQI
jgi:hypothetical protein